MAQSARVLIGLRLAPALVGAGALLTGAMPARASEVVTWTTASSRVDPAREPFGQPPAGEPARPNALRVNVFLPDGYGARRRFPVLYLLHGANAGYDYWAHPRRGDIMRAARGFPGVIVMPEGGAIGFYSSWWNGGRRADPDWERYHLDELLPLVERRLRIRRGRRWHAIAGFSTGAYGAVYYASQRPGYFGSAASFSNCCLQTEYPIGYKEGLDTAFMSPYGRSMDQLWGDTGGFYWTAHNPTRLVANLSHTRLYLSVGDGSAASAEDLGSDFEGYGPDAGPYYQPPLVTPAAMAFNAAIEPALRVPAQGFVDTARQAGADVTYRPTYGAHWWPTWRRMLTDASKNWGPFEAVPERPTSWAYETASQTGEMWDLRFSFARPPEMLEVFTRAGSRLSGQGAGVVTIRGHPGCERTLALPFAIELPAACTFAKPRLLLGPTRGMRRARRGRPFRIRVRAVGGRLRGVRIVVRDAPRRRVGRSRRFTVGGRSKRVRVRVGRRLRPGRYRIAAAGRDAAGRRVRALMRVRWR